MTYPGPSSRPEWLAALNELEREVEQSEGLLDSPDGPMPPPGSHWAPPEGLGPLPEDLRHRAALLLQRQLATAERLVEQITKSKRQRDVADRIVTGAPARTAPAFIDRAL